VRAAAWTFLALGGLVALACFVPHAEATGVCHSGSPTNWCNGLATVSTTTGGVASARCFTLRTTNTAPTCDSTSANDASWEVNAGGCITLYWFDTTTGATPPAAPNKVGIQVYNDVPAAVITFRGTSQAEPAAGSTFSFCATDTGLSSGSPRTGTYLIFIRPIKDNAVPSSNNYDITSACQTQVGSISKCDNGVLRSNMLVSALAASSPPAGSEFAYGSAGDESVTFTATRPRQADSISAYTVSFDSRHSGAGSIVETTATAMSANAATDTASSVIDNTYDAASTSYDVEYNIIGTSPVDGLPWTTFPASGHGTGITQISSTKVRATSLFTAEPGIKFDSDCTGGYATADDVWSIKLGSSGGAAVSKLNKGESYYASTCMTNARDEYLTRAMTVAREDATPTTCATIGSLTPVSHVYSHTSTLGTGSTCLASGDPGSTRYFRATNTDQNHRGLGSFTVSPTYYLVSYLQKTGTRTGTMDLTYDIASGYTDSIYQWCFVESVRHDGLTPIDTSGSAVSYALDRKSVV